jgi:hypothetical protein
MLCEPDVRTTQVSQLLHGHIAQVVERQGLWLHVKGADEYTGWIHQGYVVTMPEPVPQLSESGWNDPRPLSLNCTVRDEHGATRKLPLGALITEGQERFGGLAMTLAERRNAFPPAPDSITASAMTFFEGTSYEWGGLTPWGCDCSGLVSSSFHLHGVEVPRDAWMQAQTGTPVASMDDLSPADLLFFSDDPTGRSRTSRSQPGVMRVVHLALGRDAATLSITISARERRLALATDLWSNAISWLARVRSRESAVRSVAFADHAVLRPADHR